MTVFVVVAPVAVAAPHRTASFVAAGIEDFVVVVVVVVVAGALLLLRLL